MRLMLIVDAKSVDKARKRWTPAIVSYISGVVIE